MLVYRIGVSYSVIIKFVLLQDRLVLAGGMLVYVSLLLTCVSYFLWFAEVAKAMTGWNKLKLASCKTHHSYVIIGLFVIKAHCFVEILVVILLFSQVSSYFLMFNLVVILLFSQIESIEINLLNYIVNLLQAHTPPFPSMDRIVTSTHSTHGCEWVV